MQLSGVEKPRVGVIAPELTPRLQYVLEVLLGQLLAVEWQFCPWANTPPDWQVAATLVYTPPEQEFPDFADWMGQTAVQVQWSGVLQETATRPLAFADLQGADDPQAEANDLVDPLARAFVRLTNYPAWSGQASRDTYNRANPHDLTWDSYEWTEGAEVPRIAWELAQQLGLEPPIALPQPPLLTVDLDNPWLIQQKPFWVQAGGFVKNMLKKANVLPVNTYLQVATGKQRDPNQHFFDWLEKIGPEQNVLLFALPGTKHPLDSRFQPGHRAWEQLLRRLAEQGFALGLHPSYRCVDEPQRLAQEKDWLEQVLGRSVNQVRMHYLRLRELDTRRQFLQLGLANDYTTCWADIPGFQYGMDRPFRWFDVEANTSTDLWLHPTTLMDRTLLSYLKLTPEQGVQEWRKWRKISEMQGGQFIPLVHNELWSEAAEWRGWSQLVPEIEALFG